MKRDKAKPRETSAESDAGSAGRELSPFSAATASRRSSNRKTCQQRRHEEAPCRRFRHSRRRHSNFSPCNGSVDVEVPTEGIEKNYVRKVDSARPYPDRGEVNGGQDSVRR